VEIETEAIAVESDMLSSVERRVRRALEHVRPYLFIDGGSVELIRIDLPAGIAEVCFLGACRTCSMLPMTLRAGIERAVLHEAPELQRVEAVSRPEIEQLFDLKFSSF
jgi:Fe-S cluster biogenesis protein NfuA